MLRHLPALLGSLGSAHVPLVTPGAISPRLTFTRAQAAGVQVMRAIDLRVTLVAEGFLASTMTFERAQAAGVEAMRDTA
jgi:hypothetical protein